MSQIVAEELSVPLERITARPPDTAYTPFDRSTGSSRSTTVMGKALQLAAQDARRQILDLAAGYFEAPLEAISLKNGEALAGGKKISYPSVRDEAPTNIRPRHPCDAAREIKCPSMVLYGGQDGTSTIPVQERVQASFLENGQPLEWHFFPMATTASPQRNPTNTSRNWPSWSGPWW